MVSKQKQIAYGEKKRRRTQINDERMELSKVKNRI